MKLTNSRFSVAVCCVAVFAVVTTGVASLGAQDLSAAKHIGYPQDWSEHHIVFHNAALAEHPDLVYREPRVLHQVLKHSQIPNYGVFETPESTATALRNALKKSGSGGDWSENLQGHMGANAYPIKFAFNPNSIPDCASDFVVFALTNSSGSNLVAFNNIYVNAGGTGFCSGTAPTVLFAYNTNTAGGHILTSPIMSLDGKQIGFVESVPASAGGPSAFFHVLTWAAGQGTATMPATPTNMTTSLLSSTKSDAHSSPWIDYSSNTAYVGTDDGNMHKITGVFSGTPIVDPSGWPVPVGGTVLAPSNLQFSPPVLDQLRGFLIFGASDGNLYQINVNTALVTATASFGNGNGNGGVSPAIVAAPVIDVTDDMTFSVVADNGTAAAIAEFRTSNLVQQSIFQIGEGASTGTAMSLYEPAFSHAYFIAPPGDLSSAVLSVCGTGASDTSPWQYVIGFNAIIMKEATVLKRQLVNSVNARCSAAWSEFYNPNILGGTDFFFIGLTQDCTSPTGGLPDGCVAEERNLNPLTTSAPFAAETTINGGTSGIIADGYADPTLYPEASSIYFTARNLQIAYKLRQLDLQ